MSDEDTIGIFSQIMGRNHTLGAKANSKPLDYMTAQASTEEGLLQKIEALNAAGWEAIGVMESYDLPANIAKKK